MEKRWKAWAFLLFIGLTTQSIAQTNTFPSSGNVGIGTTSPSSLLDVEGTASVNSLLINGQNLFPNGGYQALGTGDAPIWNGVKLTNNSTIERGNPYWQWVDVNGAVNEKRFRAYWYQGGLLFRSHNDDGSSKKQLFRISHDGDVNIPNGQIETSVGQRTDIYHMDQPVRTTDAPTFRPPTIRIDNQSGLGIHFQPTSSTSATTTVFTSRNKVHGGVRYFMHDNGGYVMGNYQSGQPTDYSQMITFKVGDPSIVIGQKFDKGYSLNVNGTARAKEITVTEDTGADFVFEEDYILPSLSEVEQHIKNHEHLPEIPTAEEMKENGVKVGNFQMKLLQKIEELTLYTIEQKALLENQQRRIETLEKELQQLKRKK